MNYNRIMENEMHTKGKAFTHIKSRQCPLSFSTSHILARRVKRNDQRRKRHTIIIGFTQFTRPPKKNFKKDWFIMARRTTSKTENAITENTSVCICGTLERVFEGKKANYLTIKAMRGKNYDLFNVDCPTSIAIPDDGEKVTITGTLSTFWDKEKKFQKVIITAKSVTTPEGELF